MTRPRFGRRGLVLALFGLMFASWGALLAARGELVQPRTSVTDVLLGSLEAWGWVWVAVGGICVASALLRIGRDAIGFVAGMALLALWGASAAFDTAVGAEPLRTGTIAVICGLFTAMLGVVAGWPDMSEGGE